MWDWDEAARVDALRSISRASADDSSGVTTNSNSTRSPVCVYKGRRGGCVRADVCMCVCERVCVRKGVWRAV